MGRFMWHVGHEINEIACMCACVGRCTYSKGDMWGYGIKMCAMCVCEPMHVTCGVREKQNVCVCACAYVVCVSVCVMCTIYSHCTITHCAHSGSGEVPENQRNHWRRVYMRCESSRYLCVRYAERR